MRHQLHTSTWGSGKFQAESVWFFSWQKRIAFKCSLDLHFYALIIGFFRSALGTDQNAIPSYIPRYTPKMVSRVDYGFDQGSFVRSIIKKLFVYLFMAKQCIYLVTQIYFMQIYFHPLWFGNRFTDFSDFWIFCWPNTPHELERKAKFWEDSKSQNKTQFENKRHKHNY